ncbi:hypothetical protein [Phytohabitans rumicis]|uniref:Major facilitator superfamily (MFS) profile domain-containing protein n=1 Tax=Phytohabitans rumicis TaxID=1076125 RepID=A0A6V8L017_9ACTN|nr:hypothetical protein [Phytohabitans rumicis]GFJ87427.1 hypothetical protein Prum_010690 [Phytohabitans rumicis]
MAWAFERHQIGELTASLVFCTFVTGGMLGVLAASVLEKSGPRAASCRLDELAGAFRP